MDLSKLPKMGNSPPPPQNRDLHPDHSPVSHSIPPAAEFSQRPPDREVRGPESFIAIAIGIIFMLIGMRFAKWAIATLSGRTFDTGIIWSSGSPNAGQPVAYWDLQGYVAFTETGVFLFGLAMVVEGIVLAVFLRSRTWQVPALLATIGLSALATAFNLYVCTVFWGNNAGLPLFWV